MKKKILFISHYAGHTGAPILLLNFLRWFKKNTNIPFRILLKNGGALEKEFRKLAPVDIFNKKFFSFNFFNKVINKIPFLNFVVKKIYLKKLIQKISNENIGLIYSNTVTNGDVLKSLARKIKCPVITHVHELEYWINETGKENFNYVKQLTNQYIAVSNAVKKNLMFNHGIPESKIDVIHGFILPATDHLNKIPRDILGIPEGAIIVGGSGSEVWRKGKDLFIKLAVEVSNCCKNMPIYFLWLGGDNNDRESRKLELEIQQAGLAGKVLLIHEVTNPLDFFAVFDIFAMVSREDPYPLVNLEVASLAKPILCFDNAGGSPEFVQNDAGFVVPYLDVEDMATKVILLAKNKELREKMGERAREKVSNRHGINITAPKVLNIVRKYI